MPSCFISHTWREGEHHFAVRLSEALKQSSITVWIDQERIMPVSHIKETIKKGVEHESDVFLFVMSPETLKSEMCMYELNLAIHQMEEHGKPVIPVLFKKCRIPDLLKNICYADFRNELYFDAAVQHLLEGIRRAAEIRQLCLGLGRLDPEERTEISKILGELGDPVALGPLKNRLLFQEPDPTVRHWLASAVGNIGGRKAVEILGQAMEEPDLHARLGVIRAMLKVSESPDEEIQDAVLETLFEAIGSDSPNRRLCAVKVLIRLRQKNDEIESILSGLIYDPDNNVRDVAKEYFRKKGRMS